MQRVQSVNEHEVLPVAPTAPSITAQAPGAARAAPMIPPVLLPAVPPPRLVPRSVPEMIDEGIRAVRRDFALFASVAAVTVIPATLISAFVTALFTPFNLFNPLTWFSVGGHAAITTDGTVTALVTSGSAFAGFIITAFGTAALVTTAGLRTLGQPCDLALAYRHGRRRYWSVIGAQLATLLAVAGVTVLTFFVGSPFALFLYVAWQLAPQAAVLEGCGPIAALRRSFTLTRGGWWRLAALLVILSGLQLFATVIPGGIAALITSFTGSRDLLGGGAGAVVSALLGAFVNLVSLPVTVTVTTLFFTDQRLRTEGFDIDILLQRGAAERAKA